MSRKHSLNASYLFMRDNVPVILTGKTKTKIEKRVQVVTGLLSLDLEWKSTNITCVIITVNLKKD